MLRLRPPLLVGSHPFEKFEEEVFLLRFLARPTGNMPPDGAPSPLPRTRRFALFSFLALRRLDAVALFAS